VLDRGCSHSKRNAGRPGSGASTGSRRNELERGDHGRPEYRHPADAGVSRVLRGALLFANSTPTIGCAKSQGEKRATSPVRYVSKKNTGEIGRVKSTDAIAGATTGASSEAEDRQGSRSVRSRLRPAGRIPVARRDWMPCAEPAGAIRTLTPLLHERGSALYAFCTRAIRARRRTVRIWLYERKPTEGFEPSTPALRG
jgi:hypothetical protein